MPTPTAANIVTLLQAQAVAAPNCTALMVGVGRRRETISFAQLAQRVDRLSCGAARAGIAPGDRVLVMIPMSIDLYTVLLGLLKLGAVPVFIDPWTSTEQIAAYVALAEPRGFIGVPASHLIRLRHPALRRLPIAVTTGFHLGPLPAARSLANLLAAPGDGAVHEVTPDMPALITFTTGSSGTPKGANRSHGFLLAQHAALKAHFPYLRDDVDMAQFPVFALNNLAQGVPTVIPAIDFRHVARLNPLTILAQMRDYQVTTCTVSPPFLDRLSNHLDLHPEQTPHLRRILTGGAPVSDDQLDRWQAHFPDTHIHVLYGSTEAEPVAHIEARERLRLRDRAVATASGVCVGRPIAELQVKLVTITRGSLDFPRAGWPELELRQGQIGELLVAGRHVCTDYYRNPQAVAETKLRLADGTVFHRMGDTGYLDPQGLLWLVGRVHTTIRRDNQNIHPLLVEQAARANDSRIRRVAALAVPCAILGQRLIVIVETDAPATVKAQVQRRLLDARLPVDDIHLTNEPLPLDPRHNAKIDYAALAERLHLA